MSVPPWWRGAVIYEIYPRSFVDSNGDGVGDLPGIVQRLEYVAALGVLSERELRMRWIAVLLLSVSGSLAAATYDSNVFRARLPQDEIIYFLLPDRFENGDPSNDRGGLRGGRLETGFDPTHKGFYHGGDLRGLIDRLDYIQGLGATALWLGPIYKNKPVQGPPGQQTAGYHGYWITDFTRVDEHFGTERELKELIGAAHARGMKVYLDIITNHTADVISYRQCPESDCVYRSRADYPYSRAGGTDGSAINEGFLGDGVQTDVQSGRALRRWRRRGHATAHVHQQS